MTELRRIGTTHQPSDGIEEAEFVEVDSAAPIARASKKRTSRLGTILLAVFGGMVAWMLLVSALRQIGAWPTDGASGDQGVATMDAQQMLSEWTRQVTGSVNDSGMFLVDGVGAPGSACDARTATQLMRFGGLKLLNHDVYDVFQMTSANDGSVLEGAFWFDPAASTIVTRNIQIFDRNGKPQQSLPDATAAVHPEGNGILEFRGTTYHLCKLQK